MVKQLVKPFLSNCKMETLLPANRWEVKLNTGHLMGLVDTNGNIDMRYHQLNYKGEIMTGNCQSKPEILENGKIGLHENWKWTSGDFSVVNSIIEEI